MITNRMILFFAFYCFATLECRSDVITWKGTVIPSEAVSYRTSSNIDAFRRMLSDGDVINLDFCRWRCITGIRETNMVERISYENLTGAMKVALSSSIKKLKARAVPEVIAQKYSLMSAFEISWNAGIQLLHSIAKEGAFTHVYSLEEAMFILHMHIAPPWVLGRWLKGDSYHEEELFFSSCLVAAIATVLSSDGRLKDFYFDMPTESTHSREELVNANIDKLIHASGVLRELEEFNASREMRNQYS